MSEFSENLISRPVKSKRPEGYQRQYMRVSRWLNDAENFVRENSNISDKRKEAYIRRLAKAFKLPTY